jgi:hypothetical protein
MVPPSIGQSCVPASAACVKNVALLNTMAPNNTIIKRIGNHKRETGQHFILRSSGQDVCHCGSGAV